jgi:hypothetical protein
MFTYFYHGILEKVTKAFGSLFNGIYVAKYDADGNVVEKNLVPINYANRHAYIARLAANPDLEDSVYVEQTFPRLAYEISAITYDPSRKFNTIHRHSTDSAVDGEKATAYQSVAYNVDFSLTIIAKHVIDANQILEQILPYFTPSFTIKITSVPAMGYEENIPIELNSIAPSDNYEAELDMQPRQVRYDLNFTAKINFHGPVESAKIIRKVQVDVYTPPDFTTQKMAKTPRKARSVTATDPATAGPQDDFGYSETWQQFNDNKRFNPDTGEDEEIPE